MGKTTIEKIKDVLASGPRTLDGTPEYPDRIGYVCAAREVQLDPSTGEIEVLWKGPNGRMYFEPVSALEKSEKYGSFLDELLESIGITEEVR